MFPNNAYLLQGGFMEIFKFIAIFLTPIVGLSILMGRYNTNIKQNIIDYINILVFSSVVTNAIIYFVTKHMQYMFTPSFFVKYSLLNIVVVVIITIFKIVIKENISIKLEIKSEKK